MADKKKTIAVNREEATTPLETGTYVSLLRGFDSELDHTTLQNGVTICRMKEGKHWNDDTRFAGRVDIDNAFVMEYRLTRAKQQTDPFELFRDTATAMRLIGPGAVFAGDVLKPRNFMVRGPRWNAPRFQLTKERLAALDTLTATLERGISNPIQGAMSRFNLAYDRLTDWVLGREWEQAGDRLIDYWIAFESLFLPDDSPQELGYRVSLRVAYFISASPEERRTVFREIRRSYKARSVLVHGRQPRDNVYQITDYTEEALRRALFRAVQSPESIDGDRLDDAILMGTAEP